MEQIFYPIYEASAVIFFFPFPLMQHFSPSLCICHLLLVFLVAFPYFSWLSISFQTSVSSRCFADWAESQRVGTLPFLFTFPPTVPHLYSLFLSSVFCSPFLLFQLTSLSPYFIPIAATTSKVCNYSCSRILHVLEPVCVNTYAYTRHALNLKDAHIVWQQNAKL